MQAYKLSESAELYQFRAGRKHCAPVAAGRPHPTKMSAGAPVRSVLAYESEQRQATALFETVAFAALGPSGAAVIILGFLL
jgi:hypothetical protein